MMILWPMVHLLFLQPRTALAVHVMQTQVVMHLNLPSTQVYLHIQLSTIDSNFLSGFISII